MNWRLVLQLAAALSLTFASIFVIATAARAEAGSIEASQAIARASIGQATSGVIYLRLLNRARAPDRLTGAATIAAARVDLHVTQEDGGVVRMRRVEGLEIAGGENFAFEPGGAHIMLSGLKAPLREGDAFALTLQFETAGPVTIEVAVGSVAAGAGGDGGEHGAH